MTKTFCDKCKIEVVWKSAVKQYGIFELCLECSAELASWIGGYKFKKKNGKNTKSISST